MSHWRPVDFGPAMAVAESVLYEGYLLYPYRQSSAKNRVRWQFGILAPPAWAEAAAPQADGVAGSAESWWCRTECLVEGGPQATIELRLRFLQLLSSGEHALEQATARDVPFTCTLGEAQERPMTVPLAIPGGEAPVSGAAWPGAAETATGPPLSYPLSGTLSVAAERLTARSPLYKLSIRVENTASAPAGLTRPQALRHSFISTHLLLGTAEGSFLSLLDTPEWARAVAGGTCSNVRTFPVLAGPDGTSNLMLSSPIILYDHPQVAPESPGDLFDATEIDEILSLRALTLTDAEKAEARLTDPLAAHIVDRVENMPTEVLARLHGAIRSLRRVTSGAGKPAGEAQGGAPEPEPDFVVVGRAKLARGSRVRLRPRATGTDAQDMFLAGRAATVTEVLSDVDGSKFLAVSLDNDPRAAMGAGPGRLLHFSPDEVEPWAVAR